MLAAAAATNLGAGYCQEGKTEFDAAASVAARGGPSSLAAAAVAAREMVEQRHIPLPILQEHVRICSWSRGGICLQQKQ